MSTVFTAPRPQFDCAAAVARQTILSQAPEGVERGIFEEVLVGDSRYFAIVWDKNAQAVSDIRIMVAIVRKGRDTWFVSYRDETAEPQSIMCPPWLIDAAGDPPSQAAAVWRDQCRAFYERMSLPMGAVILFEKPIALPDGRFEDRFRFIPGGREQRCFVSCTWGRAHAIPDFADRRWRVERVH